MAAFTGGREAPSARFRVRQYMPLSAQEGIDIVELSPGLGAYPPPKHWERPAWLIGSLAQRVPQIAAGSAADVTLLHREMISRLYTLEGFTRWPRLIDVDDAIHLFRRGWAAKRLAERADLVVVGNDWLAETWRQWNAKVEILPTVVDTRFFNVRPLPERPSIGWIGSFGNLRYLESIAPALAEWVAALSSIRTDRRGAEELGAAGRAVVHSRYSLVALAPRPAQLIRGLAR